MYATHIPGLQQQQQKKKLTKSEKKRRQQAKLYCGEGHFATWMKVSGILRIFGITAQPGEKVHIPDLDSQWCSQCKREAEMADRAKAKAIARVHHLYRPEQATVVTLHNVVFAFKPKGQDTYCPYRGSFYARVTAVDDDATVSFTLMPRDDVNFYFVCPIAPETYCISPEFGSRLQRSKEGICYVQLARAQLERELGLVVLGRRCKPDRCGEDGCGMHDLRPIQADIRFGTPSSVFMAHETV